MTQTTPAAAPARAASPRREVSDVDALAALSSAELDAVYRGGVLFDLDALDGAPRGRMLTVAGPLGHRPARDALAAFARAGVFPWHGKSFQSTDAGHGRGINRVILLGEKYPFETRVEPSAIDGAPCVRLDYGLAENPFFIRPIRDELRRVGPDLYLGPAMLERAARAPALVLWFAIDASHR
ncbi:MAG TPA: hypothetical protein RMH85_10200 [Polyangiaceae bacterium LLY-WYZ-15_(1-7)]|nr:hypothetical protein [Polyangiaceae bacterium LLY-WYZ-15_(1-7)]HJL00210.1 hypothetical protein [Polyangiaceae bacterium LLY-WYZ-15_(1-7)]HJL08862.1 hypothetical protein [Polyangiaceae bacterium LLY-WYZ-15_(1-7)]HJL20963.1 hypothetical protein [Polyangiaceae bacterium LLY-WYZ-15_(1-7)]HJL31913.1 hypothetical protein [Polyangiaceae bacterium LLY-WYZ-15_(1-7)]